MAVANPKYRAQDFAEKFDVHVKTILRAATGAVSPSDWAPEPLAVADVAKAFGMEGDVLIRVMKGHEHLIDAERASAIIGCSMRRFHQRRAEGKGPKPIAQHGRTVRYALSAVALLSDL